MSCGAKNANLLVKVYKSYLRQPAKNESITFVISDSGLISLNSWSTKRFEIEGWSTIMSKSSFPPLEVVLYV